MVGQAKQYRTELVDAGLQPLVDAVEEGETREDQAKDVLGHSVLLGIKNAIDARNPVLNTFRAEQHSVTTQEFVGGDRWHRDTAADRVRRSVAEHAVTSRNVHPDQSAVIEREAKKKRSHKPLRQL